MAEVRVQCPECRAKMKLTSSVKKVRCPTCDHTFVAAEHRIASKSTLPVKKKPEPVSSSVFEFDDDDDPSETYGISSSVFSESTPSPPKKKNRSKPKKKQRPKRRSETRPGAIDPAQLRKFGLLIFGMGIASFILPFMGLQLKAMADFPPEMQVLGGVMFLIIGGVIIAASFLDQLGSIARNGFTLLKWGTIGLIVFFIVASIALLGLNAGVNYLANRQEDKRLERIAKMEAQNANRIAENQAAMRAMQQNRPAIPQGSSRTTLTASPSKSNSSSSVPSFTSPDVSVSSRPANAAPTGNPSASASPISGRSPGAPPGFGGPRLGPRGVPNMTQSNGQLTVTVTLQGFQPRDLGRNIQPLREAAQTFRMRIQRPSPNLMELVFDGVDDVQKFADRIPFGRVSTVDTENNRIVVEPQ